MPQMSTIISGAASLGVLAGVMSGIFYLVLTGIRWAGRIRSALLEESSGGVVGAWGRCVACARKLGSNSAVQCKLCSLSMCRGPPCSQPGSDCWICVLCHAKRDLKAAVENKKSTGKIGGENLQVRHFIENIVQNLVGGSLDVVNLGRLSTEEPYTKLLLKFHTPLCHVVTRMEVALTLYLSSKNASEDESPSLIHDELSHLIAQIIREAQKLPNLSIHNGGYRTPQRVDERDLVGKNYEDILATAILNKIVEKHNGVNSLQNEEEIDDIEGTPDDEPLSLTIEEKIEEVTTTYLSSDEDESYCSQTNQKVPFSEYGLDMSDNISHTSSDNNSEVESPITELTSSNSTWEDNWFLCEKKCKKNSAVPPVAMLVPNPSQECKALIGGIDAEDMSDLSESGETSADNLLEDDEINLFDVQPSSDDNTNDSAPTSSRSTATIDVTSNTLTTSPEDDMSFGDTLNLTDSMPTDSTSPPTSLTQKDREVIEEFGLATTIMKPPVPQPRTRTVSVQESEKNFDEVYNDTNQIQPPICSIAVREKAKWNNAVQLENNPYSAENIAKRLGKRDILQLSRSSSVDYLNYPQETTTSFVPQYSRDYYVNASKSPNGEDSLSSVAQSKKPDSPVSVLSDTSIEITKRIEIEPVSRLLETSLPKVKELREKWLFPSNMKKVESPSIEIECTEVNVSKIIERLTSGCKKEEEPVNKQEEVYKEIEQIREISRKDDVVDEDKNNDFISTVSKYHRPIKPVHSLTARSIPKVVRDNLKKSQSTTVGNKSISSPNIPSLFEDELSNFDIRGTKIFWENLAAEQ